MRQAPARAAIVTSLLLCAVARADGLRAALAAAGEALAANASAELAEALEAVVAHDDKATARGLIRLAAAAPPEHEAAYWQVARAVGGLQSEPALREVGKFLAKASQTRLPQDLLLAFEGNRSPAALTLYADLVAGRKVSATLKHMACDRLGELATREAVDVLLEALADDDAPELGEHARQVLVALVGEDLGDPVNWRGWWKQQRAQGLPEPKVTADATGTVVDRVDPARRGGLTTTRAGRVLVVRQNDADYDHIQRVLERMHVPHEVIQREAFQSDPQAALTGTAAVLFNCVGLVGCVCPDCVGGERFSERAWGCNPACDVHDQQDYSVQGEALERLKDFVEVQGGAVFAEDFGIYDFVSKAWPEYVQIGPVLRERSVSFVPVPGQGQSPLLRGVFDRAPAGQTRERFAAFDGAWQVDADSPMILVGDPERVDVLLVSPELRAEQPEGGAVAVAFHPGRGPQPGPGLVLHVLSHFGKQGSQADEFALQNLLVNFLLEAQSRFARRGR